MFRLMLVILTVFALASEPAQAAPVVTAITGWLTATFGAAIGGFIAQMGASFLLSRLSMALASRPKQEIQRAELHRETALPAYRFVYGTCWAPGTPASWHVIGNTMYICYLLNSRPSALTEFTVLFDKRVVTFTGDPFDFSASGGATATNDPFAGHLKFWIGRGSQTTCPAQIVSEASGQYLNTDAWQGRTVLWARLDCGYPEERAELWPRPKPELNVDGNWSLIYDPRDGGTRHTRNQALIVLDALRNNPLRPYSDVYLWLDTFSWGADVADQAVPVRSGGTIPRYRCDGVLVFADGQEIEDMIAPLEAAGASRLTRVGGRLGYVPATWQEPVHTITDFTEGQPLDLSRWRPADSLYTYAVARYTAPDRGYESADAPPYQAPSELIVGSGPPRRLDVPLDFVIDPRQAQRVAKIELMRALMQREVGGETFPDAFELVGGSVATVNLAAPLTAFNGTYEVQMINPAAGINDDASVTLRLPISLRETSPAVYQWNHLTDEKLVEGLVLDGSLYRVQPPASVSILSGTATVVVSGNNVIAAVGASWTASPSASAVGYDWQYRIMPSGPWKDGGYVDASSGDGSTYTAEKELVQVGSSYRVRVRTVGLYGKSVWLESGSVTAAGPTATLSTPVMISATPGSSRITVRARQSWTAGVSTLRFFSSQTNNFATATNFFSVSAGASVEVERIDLTPNSGETWYYWTRAEDDFGNVSAVSAVISATVT